MQMIINTDSLSRREWQLMMKCIRGKDNLHLDRVVKFIEEARTPENGALVDSTINKLKECPSSLNTGI